MYVLGINGGVRLGYRDASAVLMKDGEIIIALEEERFNRIKSSPHQLPELSIRKVLEYANINIQDIDVVATHGSTWGDDYENVLFNYFVCNFGYCPPVKRYHHHDCHAAGAFYASGYEEALIFTWDNSGDGIGTQIAIGRHHTIQVIERISRPNSLGMFYGMMTQYCGFVRDSDEYKLMGLAPYGQANIDLSKILHVHSDGFDLNTDFIQKIIPGHPQPSIQQPIYSEHLIELLGPKRLAHQDYSQYYKNVASSTQFILEEAMKSIVSKYVKITGINKICIAGGVGLNCAANKALLELDEVEALFVQPASGDAGISQGAAYLASIENGILPQTHNNIYWGTEYSNEEFEILANKLNVKYQKINEPASLAADMVAQGKVIGWFQGRMEFGPRALGNRSILADPTRRDIQSIVNQKIKFREGFRPFCPSLLESEFDKYFMGKQKEAPYMTINYSSKQNVRDELPGVIHVNDTARIQTVRQNQNPLYFKYLNNLKDLTGHGVSLNTSFNINYQPIVENPLQAISTFYGSGLDALILGDFLLLKN